MPEHYEQTKEEYVLGEGSKDYVNPYVVMIIKHGSIHAAIKHFEKIKTGYRVEEHQEIAEDALQLIIDMAPSVCNRDPDDSIMWGRLQLAYLESYKTGNITDQLKCVAAQKSWFDQFSG